MTNEEKQALIEHIETDLNCLRNITLRFAIECEKEDIQRSIQANEIALAALTAQPVISDDTKRMDWLCAHCVEVRYPLMYGSREMFRAQQDSEEWDLPHHTTLREQVDAAIANEVQE